jgi:hypothetical protein
MYQEKEYFGTDCWGSYAKTYLTLILKNGRTIENMRFDLNFKEPTLVEMLANLKAYIVKGEYRQDKDTIPDKDKEFISLIDRALLDISEA